jgi:hypothetical protein
MARIRNQQLKIYLDEAEAARVTRKLRRRTFADHMRALLGLETVGFDFRGEGPHALTPGQARVSVTDEERDAVQALAAEAGMQASDYCRALLGLSRRHRGTHRGGAPLGNRNRRGE